jgi:hypothetical protein
LVAQRPREAKAKLGLIQELAHPGTQKLAPGVSQRDGCLSDIYHRHSLGWDAAIRSDGDVGWRGAGLKCFAAIRVIGSVNLASRVA